MADTEYLDLRGDGRIVLYKRKGLKKPRWQARISVPNATGYKFVTTKTTDLTEAQIFAANLYEELYFLVKAGGSLSSRTFKQVFDEWEKTLNDRSRTRHGGKWDDTIARVRSYALPYFEAKRVSDLKTKDFSDYWDWRITNYANRPPCNATLKREKVCLMPLLKFARQKGYIADIPVIETPAFKSQRRSTFSAKEWQQLYTKARSWVEEAKKLATWRDRYVAQQYFLILANTGMRIGELRNLRWSDLRMMEVDGTKQMIAWVKGKTGEREVIFQPGADRYVKRLYDLRLEELSEAPDSDETVICHKDGRPVQSLKKSFASLMKFAGVPIERNGISRTIYSLRHFYATQRLENETSPFLLAKQMGTSVEMLEKFYGQTTVNATTAKSVSRGNQRGGSNPEQVYPFE